MEERTTGLILRTRPLTESSLIVQWLTADHGRMSTVAKGARRPKSPLAGKLDLFYSAEFTFRRSRRSDLHTLCELNVLNFHAGLRRDLAALTQAAYLTHLVELMTEADTPLPEIFLLLSESASVLAEKPFTRAGIFGFELKMLDLAGLAPDFERTQAKDDLTAVLEILASAPAAALLDFELSSSTSRNIENFLQSHLIEHLGRLPKGRSGALSSQEKFAAPGPALAG
jgi:DNA repair protein RecO (recombination protein O)